MREEHLQGLLLSVTWEEEPYTEKWDPVVDLKQMAFR